MDRLDQARAQAEAAEALGVPAPAGTAPYQARRTRNVTIKSVARTASWRLESPEDIDRALAELRRVLTAELAEHDILNVEF